MFNPYVIILSLFIVAGLTASFWGWRIISKSRESLAWPHTDGTITRSDAASEADDLLPLIEYSYAVDGRSFQTSHQFPPSVSPSQELSKQYLQRYPVGVSIQVYYQPDNPQHATIEPGMASGDWFVFALGLLTTIFGIVFLFFSG